VFTRHHLDELVARCSGWLHQLGSERHHERAPETWIAEKQ
jgi:hypothetical protein